MLPVEMEVDPTPGKAAHCVHNAKIVNGKSANIKSLSLLSIITDLTVESCAILYLDAEASSNLGCQSFANCPQSHQERNKFCRATGSTCKTSGHLKVIGVGMGKTKNLSKVENGAWNDLAG